MPVIIIGGFHLSIFRFWKLKISFCTVDLSFSMRYRYRTVTVSLMIVHDLSFSLKILHDRSWSFMIVNKRSPLPWPLLWPLPYPLLTVHGGSRERSVTVTISVMVTVSVVGRWTFLLPLPISVSIPIIVFDLTFEIISDRGGTLSLVYKNKAIEISLFLNLSIDIVN